MSSETDYSLPKNYKLRKSIEYERVFGKGGRVRTDGFDILSVDNSLEHCRFGMVVGKRKISSAVDRNRVKRVLREVFRRNKSLFGSRDILFLARKGSEKLNYHKVKKEIEEAFRSSLS